MKCKLCNDKVLGGEEYCLTHFKEVKEAEFCDITEGGFFKWVEFFLKEYMPQKSPEIHKEIVSLYFSLYNPNYINRYNRQLEEVAYRGSGKGQPLTAKVITPDGWKTFGELKVGDKLYGSAGKEIKITHLHPITEMDIYEVTTRDGRKTQCDEDHLWTLEDTRYGKGHFITRPIKELFKIYKSPHRDNRDNKVRIDFSFLLHPSKAIQFPKKNLLVDPYILGLWIGDGHSATNTLTGEKNDLEFYRKELDSIGYNYSRIRLRNLKVGTMTISDLPVSKRNVKKICLSSNLRTMGLYNNKHIPFDYLHSSIDDRVALLQGLVDTDGYIEKNGRAFSLSTISEQLKNDYVYLVRSLGGTCTVGNKVSKLNGKEFHSFNINCRLKNYNPARLPRKANRWKGSYRVFTAITKIEKIGKAQRRCITVDAKDGLYITDDFMVTHNSTVLNFFIPLYLMSHNNKKIKIFAEVPENGTTVVKKIEVTLKEKFGVIASKTGGLAEEFVVRMRDELTSNRRLQMFYGDKIEDAIDSIDGQWTRKAFKFNGCFILGVGSGQMIRGRVKGAYRPTFIIFDDIYDETNITDTQRKTIKNWFYAGAMNSLDDIMGKALLTGTILHEDTVLVECMNSSMWKSVKFYPMPLARFKDLLKHMKVNESNRICHLPFEDEPNEIMRTTKQIEYFKDLQEKEDWGLAWKERNDLYYMAIKYKDSVETSSTSLFYQEYFHLTISEGMKKFRSDYFQKITKEWRLFNEFGYTWFDCPELYNEPQVMNIEFGCDLSGVSTEADNTAIQPVGALPDKRLIVFPTTYGKMNSRDVLTEDSASLFRYEKVVLDRQYVQKMGFLDELFRLYLEYVPSQIKIGIAGEENKMPEDVRLLFQANGIYCQVNPRPQNRSQGSKYERIRFTCLKYYETLSTYHCNGTGLLELELEHLTKYITDDCADALEVAFFNIQFPAKISYSQFASPQVLQQRGFNKHKRKWVTNEQAFDWRLN